MRTASSLGVNQWNAKMMVGKSVSKDILTYVNGVNLSKDFLKVSNALKLKPTKMSNRVGDVEKTVNLLKETLTSVEKENMILKTRIDNLQSNTMKLEDRLDEIGDFVAHTVEFGPYTKEEKDALRRKYNIKEFSEEEKQLKHDFNEIAMKLQKEKGYLDEKDWKELKRRFKAKYRKREKAKQGTKEKGKISSERGLNYKDACRNYSTLGSRLCV